jgi:hypothetical protein
MRDETQIMAMDKDVKIFSISDLGFFKIFCIYFLGI